MLANGKVSTVLALTLAAAAVSRAQDALAQEESPWPEGRRRVVAAKGVDEYGREYCSTGRRGGICAIGCTALECSPAQETYKRANPYAPLGCGPGACGPCPAAYDEICSVYGGCDPVNATETATENLACTCAPGFAGRRCTDKTSFVWWLVPLNLLPVAVLARCLICCSCFENVGPTSWDHPPYAIRRIPGAMINGGLLVKLITTAQLAAAAFDVNIPWSVGFAPPKVMQFFVLDLEVGFGWQLLTVTMPPFVFVFLDLCGCGCEDIFNKVAPPLIRVMAIPGIRICGGVFFGCTYHVDGWDNVFDADPSLSCWSDDLGTWWWWYAVAVFFCGWTENLAGLGIVAQASDVYEVDELHPFHAPRRPATPTYERVFIVVQVNGPKLRPDPFFCVRSPCTA